MARRVRFELREKDPELALVSLLGELALREGSGGSSIDIAGECREEVPHACVAMG